FSQSAIPRSQSPRLKYARHKRLCALASLGEELIWLSSRAIASSTWPFAIKEGAVSSAPAVAMETLKKKIKAIDNRQRISIAPLSLRDDHAKVWNLPIRWPPFRHPRGRWLFLRGSGRRLISRPC